ncbi:MAG TPA: phosphoribosylanthranilate isomerase [Terriglobales bacterium]|nr:phosphoribosylanthranilate isomerase [Terriglobales bacterium]
MARVKICGIRSLADMQIAVQQGTDAIGVLVGKLHSSSDFVPANLAAEICERTPPFVTSVLVTHLEDPDSVLALADTIPSAAVQLHSDITPALIDTLRRALAPRKVIAKIGVEGPSAIERARDLDQRVDAIVLDSVNRATDQVGGTGLTHDWSISSQIVKQISTPVILAGGLTPANVGSAIRQVRPWAVDVNSGVRNQAGFKDGDLIRAFIETSKLLD